MTNAVTLDFHNTIGRCDSWFELEVRGLLPGFLAWQASQNGGTEDRATIQSAADTYQEIRRTVIQTGLELTAEQCVAEGLRRLGRETRDVDIARGIEDLMRATLHDLAPLPGAIELIRSLQRHDVRLGIVSSAVYHPFLEWSLEAFGVRDAFAAVVTSASAGYYKSRTEIYLQTLDTLGVPPEHAVHIGDSWRWDVGTAKRAGIQTVWLNANGDSSEVDPDLEMMTLSGAAPAVLALLGLVEAVSL